jgi:serine phosphatase RsbU (regulator of sigma subunit)
VCETVPAAQASNEDAPINADKRGPLSSVKSVDRPPPVRPPEDVTVPVAEDTAPAHSRGWYWLPVATLLVGLIVTGALALVSRSQYNDNEKRLLSLRIRDAGALITAAVPATETPLASAAELADATNGNAQKFKQLVAREVGTKGQQFVSLSLWRAADLGAGPVAVQGLQPKLASPPSTATSFLTRAAHASRLSVIGLLASRDARLGYAFVTPGATRGFIAYGESRLPPTRRSRLQKRSAFAGLDYAIYLGPKQDPRSLLVTDQSHLPLKQPADMQTLPFGNSSLTLAMSSHVPLAGSLPQRLPWIIAVLGTLLSIAAAAMTFRLTQRRRDAEQLAGRLEVSASENRRLYAEQRSIAQTLQHALLPEILPQIPGIQTSARYEAGERGVDVGGDWYDVIELDGRRLLLVVGDVSGRGLRAATTMASLRYAIRAYAAQNDEPAEILTKISRLVNVAETGQLATVLCALVDIESRRITVTSAGHLPPLLITGGDGSYLDTDVGLPIGVEAGTSYRSTTDTVPAGSTVVVFTDGLVELRGESLDDGLERLREAATSHDVPLAELLGTLVTELPRGRSEDDIAIVGVRWTS